MLDDRCFDLEIDEPPLAGSHNFLPRVTHVAIVLLVLIMAAGGAWMAFARATLVVLASGSVRPAGADSTGPDAVGDSVSSPVGGRVVAVTAQVGDEVQRGEALLEIDTTPIDLEIEKARVQTRALQASLADLKRLETSTARRFESARRKARLELERERERLALAEKRRAVEARLAELEVERREDRVARTRKLVAVDAVSEEERLAVERQARRAREELERARLPLDASVLELYEENLELVQRDEEMSRLELAMKRRSCEGEIEALATRLAELHRQRRLCQVRAPIDGVVTESQPRVGDIVQPGKLGLVVAPRGELVFEALVSDEDIAFLREGLPTRIKLRAFPHVEHGTVAGTVAFISPDARRSRQSNDPGGYRVKIELDPGATGEDMDLQSIRLGMRGEAEIVTGQESVLFLLVRRIQQTVSFS